VYRWGDNPPGASNNVAPKPKIVQTIVRSVLEGTFIHFYLACGHLITAHKEDFKGKLPSVLECWACEQEMANRERRM
jgi:hypothetical protein